MEKDHCQFSSLPGSLYIEVGDQNDFRCLGRISLDMINIVSQKVKGHHRTHTVTGPSMHQNDSKD